MIELRGTIRNLAKWFRLCERLVDRSPRMERNMDTGAMVVGGLTSTGVLTRGQMARALREGALDEARSGGTGGGVIAGAISWVNVRKYINNKDLRTSCGGVTLAMLMAAAITVAPTAGIPRNSANVPSSGPQPAGSIPRTPSPSVGDGNSVHPYVSDVNQGHQKKMLNKITSVTAAAVVGIAATVAGAQSAAVQWRVEDGGNGHWYLLDSSRRPWTDADANAVGRGGHLVTVNAYAEHLFLRSSVFSYCCSMSDTWIGATRSNTKENYHWVTGEPFSTIPEIYFNNNRAGWDAPALYLEQVIRFDWVGEWGGESNSANEGNFSVIEWEADCNNDGIVDYGQCQDGSLPDANTNNIPDCCESGSPCPPDPCSPSSVLLVDTFEGATLDPQKWTTYLPYECSRVQPVSGSVEFQARGHLESRAQFPVLDNGIEIRTRFTYISGGEFFDTAAMTDAAPSSGAISNGLLFTFINYPGYSPFLIHQASNTFKLGAPVTSGSVSLTAGDTFEAVMRVTPGLATAELRNITNPSGVFAITRTWSGVPLGNKVVCYNRDLCDTRTNLDLIEIIKLGNLGPDCDNDGSSDECAIASGAPDINHNTIPDTCECIGDIYVDGIINGGDLGVLLAYWGPTTNAAASIACDLNVDGVVNGSDLGILLAYWGPCSN